MFYKIGKKIFLSVRNILHFTQIVLIFLAFATVLYWLFELGGATFIQPVAPFFEAIKGFTHLFYQRTVSVEGSPMIDFSFLIITFVMIGIVWGLKYVIEAIEEAESKYDSIYNALKKKAEKLFNLTLEQNVVLNECKNNKFLILVGFKAKDLTKDSYYNKDANVEVEGKEKTILADFVKTFESEMGCQVRILQDSALLYFNNINTVDKVLYNFEKSCIAIKEKYKHLQWKVDTLASIETYSSENEIMSKVKRLMTLIKLNMQNEIACLSTFKQRYALIENAKLQAENQGVYKIENGDEEVFCLKKKIVL